MKRAATAVQRIWVWFCIGAFVLLLSARALHFATVALPGPLDELLGRILELQLMLLWNVFLTLEIQARVILAALLLLLIRFKWFVRTDQGQWFIRPWVECFLWGGIALNNPLLDANPELATLYALVFPVIAYQFLSMGDRLRARTFALAIAWPAVLGLWLLTSPTPPVIVNGTLWVLVGASALLLLGHRIARLRDFLAVLIVPAGFFQLLSLFVAPAPLLHHGGTVLGTGRVYSFCEMPGGGRLFAALNSCDDAHVERCKGDYIAEYDLADLSRRKIHSPFDGQFFGRMANILCLEDAVQLAMSSVWIDGRYYRQNVMELAVAGPPRLVKRLLTEEAGARPVYDRANDAVYYTDEFSNRVTRVDRKHGGTVDQFLLGEPLRARSLTLIPLTGSLQTDIDAISERRNSVFFAEWLRGSKVYEVDRSRIALKGKYLPNNGGTFSVAIDDELGRLILSSLWGIDVIDLERGDILFRRRSELGARLAVIDTRRNLVYVPATIGHSIRVFDRVSFELLGKIALGTDARNGYLSKDGRYFFASNHEQHFYWDAELLAQRFRH